MGWVGGLKTFCCRSCVATVLLVSRLLWNSQKVNPLLNSSTATSYSQLPFITHLDTNKLTCMHTWHNILTALLSLIIPLFTSFYRSYSFSKTTNFVPIFYKEWVANCNWSHVSLCKFISCVLDNVAHEHLWEKSFSMS